MVDARGLRCPEPLMVVRNRLMDMASGEITILSDGTPWRPLIHVDDMARAIDWAIQRERSAGDFW